MGELDQARKKSEEQFPLLKVVSEMPASGNGGDCCCVRAPRSVLDRISEYTSAFGMTLMLIGISVLGVYSLGILVNRRQSLLMRFITEKYPSHPRHHYIGGPTTDVFYHKIFLPDQEIVFQQYSAYLSEMALKYPYLKFNVYFLLDDSYEGSIHKHSNRLKRILQYHQRKVRCQQVVPTQKEVLDFLKKYPNVQITTKLLSKHMDSTPLKYKWRSMPSGTLQYYCGVNAVWKHGGIAMDLDSFNNVFQNQLLSDKRIQIIFDRHHEGASVKRTELDNVSKMSDNVDHDERETLYLLDFVSLWSSLFSNVTEHNDVGMNYATLPEKPEESLVRKHRDKRELTNTKPLATTDSELVTEIQSTKPTTEPVPEITTDTDASTIMETETITTVKDLINNYTNATALDEWNSSFFNILKRPEGMIKDVFTIFLDFGLNMNDGVFLGPEVRPVTDKPKDSHGLNGFDLSKRSILQPFLQVPEPSLPTGELKCKTYSDKQQMANSMATENLVILEAEGKFLSSSVRYHPLLGHMIHPVRLVFEPRGIIESVLATNCYGMTGEARFCNDIYFL